MITPRSRPSASRFHSTFSFGSTNQQREFDSFTDDELERALVERFSALGLLLDLPEGKKQHWPVFLFGSGAQRCLLLGVKPTSQIRPAMSAFDPKQTSAGFEKEID